MNERIKDLLEEAGFVSYGEDTGFYNIPAPAFLSRIDRLAELIVKECVGIVEGGRFLHDQAPTALFAKECSGAIKKHFGVEE